MKRHRLDMSMTGPFWGECGVPCWKRVLDLGCILLASPIIGPLMLFIAVGIKAVSPGPVFFRQERVGLGGKKFTCLKFRTMKHNAPTVEHEDYFKNLAKADVPMTKLDRKGDARLIPFGALLRAMGLDELPQIINVIRGEMSLVGPRPCTLNEYKLYRTNDLGRFETLPGLTGLWQVSGKNKTTFSQMVKLDAKYASTKSLWMDLSIMVRTPFVLLAQMIEMAGKGKSASPKQPSPVAGSF